MNLTWANWTNEVITGLAHLNWASVNGVYDALQSAYQRKQTRTALSANDCQTNEQFDVICHKLHNWLAGKKFVATEIAKEIEIKHSDAAHKKKLLA
jgi:hypothetical protein